MFDSFLPIVVVIGTGVQVLIVIAFFIMMAFLIGIVIRDIFTDRNYANELEEYQNDFDGNR